MTKVLVGSDDEMGGLVAESVGHLRHSSKAFTSPRTTPNSELCEQVVLSDALFALL